MDSDRFVLAAVGLSVALAAAVAGLNVGVDYYGCFGVARGKTRMIVGEERWTKYMHTFHYIPANFDGVLVGSSVSENLDTSRFAGYQVYNACLGGENNTEASALVHSILDNGGRLRVAFVSLDYLLLHDLGGLQAGGMQPRDYYSALGSTQLLQDYAVAAAVRAGKLPARYSPYGVMSYEDAGVARLDADRAVANLLHEPPDPRLRTVDEVALHRLDVLFKRLRSTGARIIGFFPPMYEPRRAMFTLGDAERAARALFEPGEPVVDFNDGTHRTITANPDAFIDGLHLTGAAAREVVEVLAQALASSPVGPTRVH